MKPPRPAIGQHWERPAREATQLPTRLRVEKCLPMGMLLVSYRVRTQRGMCFWGKPRKVTAVRLFTEYAIIGLAGSTGLERE